MNTLGISDDLKHKLQDVMVDKHKLTLGKTLGEGESSRPPQLSPDLGIKSVGCRSFRESALEGRYLAGISAPLSITN